MFENIIVSNFIVESLLLYYIYIKKEDDQKVYNFNLHKVVRDLWSYTSILLNFILSYFKLKKQHSYIK